MLPKKKSEGKSTAKMAISRTRSAAWPLRTVEEQPHIPMKQPLARAKSNPLSRTRSTPLPQIPFLSDSSSDSDPDLLMDFNEFHKRKLSLKPIIRSIVESKRDSVEVEPADLGESIEYNESFEATPLWPAILTYFGYAIAILLGRLEEFLIRLGLLGIIAPTDPLEKKGFAPLYSDFESFYIRFMYRKARDCWNRPIGSCPGAEIDVIERETKDYGWTFQQTGRRLRCLNLGSYNYLGFAESSGPRSKAAKQAIRHHGIGFGGTRQELGSLQLHRELDNVLAKFLGVEAAITFPMGFATNSLNLPALMGEGCLILSDKLNHCSLVLGSRLSGATVRTVKHGDINDLEKKIRQAIIEGRPRTHRPWKKIWIVVEGIYSMEGSLVKLPDVIRLKKQYNCYIYLDEAHSIGAIGKTGRGVCDLFGCNVKDIDILMGTFTKSFGSAGGYIAGSRKLINYIRATSHASTYGGTMPAPVAMQTLMSLRTIMGLDGTDEGQRRIRQLAWNTRYFRYHLHRMGFIVYGNRESPVIPLLLLQPGKVPAFSHEMLKRNIATVVVGFPATPIIETRVRFCLSASHTKEMLDAALNAIDEVGDLLELKYSQQPETVLREIQEPPLPLDEFMRRAKRKSTPRLLPL